MKLARFEVDGVVRFVPAAGARRLDSSSVFAAEAALVEHTFTGVSAEIDGPGVIQNTVRECDHSGRIDGLSGPVGGSR